MKLHIKKNIPILIAFAVFLIALSGCGKISVEDEYSLEKIDGDITCEYRVGYDAQYQADCVDTDVCFDKDKFLELFHEYCQYDPIIGTKDPMKCDLKINRNEQPGEWQEISDSEFNVRAVFGDDQRDVSIYRYDGKLYFFVLSKGDNGDPKEEGEYFVELPEEMSNYWQKIIEEVSCMGSDIHSGNDV